MTTEVYKFALTKVFRYTPTKNSCHLKYPSQSMEIVVNKTSTMLQILLHYLISKTHLQFLFSQTDTPTLLLTLQPNVTFSVSKGALQMSYLRCEAKVFVNYQFKVAG